MANTNAPFGFQQLGMAGDATAPTMGMVARKISGSANTHIFGQGDPVLNLNTGYVDIWVNGQSVQLMAGIFVSCEYILTATGQKVKSNYYPGGGITGDATVFIIPIIGTPGQKFLAQTYTATTNFPTIANIGNTIDVTSATIGGAANAVGGFYRSAATLDADAMSTSSNATKPFRIVGLYSDIAPTGAPGATAGVYNWVVVESNVTSVAAI
jgi:hypothetical protein